MGVILAGGYSSRMGKDKAQLSMCGTAELSRAAELLKPYCRQVLVSVRPDQIGDPLYRGYQLLIDPPGLAGPIAGIAAAFDHDPTTAWLAMAVDMPYVEQAELEELLENRRPDRAACCFYNPSLDGPEPLLSLFEPEFRPRLDRFVSDGRRSLYRLLKDAPIGLITPRRESALFSINTPEEYQNAQEAVCDDSYST